jgi:hypothetical protein
MTRDEAVDDLLTSVDEGQLTVAILFLMRHELGISLDQAWSPPIGEVKQFKEEILKTSNIRQLMLLKKWAQEVKCDGVAMEEEIEALGQVKH